MSRLRRPAKGLLQFTFISVQTHILIHWVTSPSGCLCRVWAFMRHGVDEWDVYEVTGDLFVVVFASPCDHQPTVFHFLSLVVMHQAVFVCYRSTMC